MPTQDDRLFGQIAIKRQLVTLEQVNESLRKQAGEEKAGLPRRTLGEILAAAGHVTALQVEMVLDLQRQLKTPKTMGPYELIGKLGEGGMGTVYHALLPSTGLEVALKVLSAKIASDASFLTRFRREADVGLKLDHPSIIHTFDVGEDKGSHFMALELVEGGDLEGRVKSAPLPEKDALRIMIEICNALQYAHEHGVVHRDIKPTNILFDKEGNAKLGDFGLVKYTDPEVSQLTEAGSMVGTPQYVSPEQARGESTIDIRSDIYSLGATFYRIVTGEVPFKGGSPLEVIARRLTGELVSPRTINPAISAGVTAIITKMMARDRGDRYPQPADVLHGLQRVMNGKFPERSAIAAGKSSVQMQATQMPGASSPRRYEALQNPTIQMGIAVGAGLALLLIFTLTMIAFGKKPDEKLPGGETGGGRSAPTLSSTATSTALTPAPIPTAVVQPAPAAQTPLLAPISLAGPSLPGLVVRFYDAPNLTRLAGYDMAKTKLLGTISLDQIDLDGPGQLRKLFGRDSNLLIEFSGLLNIPHDGPWNFYLTSDGSARLILNNDREVVSNEPRTRVAEAHASAEMRTGLYAFRVQYSPASADARVNLSASSAVVPRSTIPAGALKHLANDSVAVPPIATGNAAGATPLERLEKLRSQFKAQSAEITIYNHTVEDGALSRIDVSTAKSIEFSVLRDYPEIHMLTCHPIHGPHSGAKIDLASLAGSKITNLNLEGMDLSDLASLKNLNLYRLQLTFTDVTNLAPLTAIKSLRALDLGNTAVVKLDDLRACRLHWLRIDECAISDLSPLADMPLRTLIMNKTRVRDLSPLSKLPLEDFECEHTPVDDFKPLAGGKVRMIALRGVTADLVPLARLPLEEIKLDYRAADAPTLKSIKSLRRINDSDPAEFFKRNP